MKIYSYPSAKFKTITLKVEQHTMVISIGSHVFRASYPTSVNLDLVDKGYFDLMMYMLFFGLEEVDLTETTITTTGTKKIVSYSGGADSTAIVEKFGGIPVHVFRYWSRDYEQRQIRAVINAMGMNISTSFEKIRTLYLGENKTGFNVGIGYASVFFPMMPALQADTIQFGVVFDDISFYYGKVFKYVSDFSNTRTYNIIKLLQSFGIHIEFPMAGYSEVITTRIADAGRIKNFSSCNTGGTTDKCLNCYKCFRKEAIRGNKIDLNANPSLKRRLKEIFSKFPLKMASSTIYGIQHAGYDFEEFRSLDVSFLDRVNPAAQQAFFGGQILEGYQFQTQEDLNNIAKFVEFINKNTKGFNLP